MRRLILPKLEKDVLRQLVLLCALLTLLLLLGCGGAKTLEIGKPIPLGPADSTVTKVTEVGAIDGTDIMTDEMKTLNPNNGAYLIVEWEAKNKTDNNVMVPEPAVRTEEGKYIESKMGSLTMDFATKIEGAGSMLGADLQPQQKMDTLVAVFDVPKGATLEFAFKDGYEANNPGEALLKGSAKASFYKIQDVETARKAVLEEDGFTYE